MFSVSFLKMLEYRKRNEKGLVQTPQAGPANPGTGDMEKYMTIAAKYWINDMDIGVSGGIEQTVEQEYQAYITAPLSLRNVIILNFWEVGDFVNDISVVLMGHRRHIAGLTERPFPTLFAMAMDYLPIQASAVPCERIFSSSAKTDTKRRNCISPPLMEALQMLKSYLKKEHLNFTAAWMTTEKADG
jgi:hypothetical protein